MPTNPRGHALYPNGMPGFEQSLAYVPSLTTKPIEKLLFAVSQSDSGSHDRHLDGTSTDGQNLHNQEYSLGEERLSSSLTSKRSRAEYESTQDVHQSHIQGTQYQQANVPRRFKIQSYSTQQPKEDGKEIKFRYMYLTDNQITDATNNSAKYTGRLVALESIHKNLESGAKNLKEDSLDNKQYVCTHKNCLWSFSRPSDLKRHAKSHRAPTFLCPYYANDNMCHRNGGSFARMDVLKRHLRLVHYVKDKQKLYPGPDPGWCRSCQKMFESTRDFLDHCAECANQQRPALWKTLDSNDDTDS